MIYKFKCKKGHEQEKEFSMKDKPTYIECGIDGCKEQAETPIEVPPVFILKGGGWGVQ